MLHSFLGSNPAPNDTILGRIANVLYWAGNAVAFVATMIALYMAGVAINATVKGNEVAAGDALETASLPILVGSVVWLACRTLKYILAGR